MGLNVDKVLPVLFDEDDIYNDFFVKWVGWLRPCHNLTAPNQLVLAACLRHRYNLSKKISDVATLDDVCMDDTNRAAIREELKMTKIQFNNAISILKKAKIIQPIIKPFSSRTTSYKIAPNIIPDNKNMKDFTFLVLFKNSKNDKKGN